MELGGINDGGVMDLLVALIGVIDIDDNNELVLETIMHRMRM